MPESVRSPNNKEKFIISAIFILGVALGAWLG